MQTGESTYMHTRAFLAKVKLEVNGDRPRSLGEEQANLVNSYLLRHLKYVRVGLHLYSCFSP